MMYFSTAWLCVLPLVASVSRVSWMSAFADTQRLTDIRMIPGTHNSAAIEPQSSLHYIVWPWTQNQDLSLTEQLNLGVRYLDLRVTQTKAGIQCSHRFLTDLSLSGALREIDAFLSINNSEFVLVYLRPDWDNRESLQLPLVSTEVHKILGDRLFKPTAEMKKTLPVSTPLGALRGRVVLFHSGADKWKLAGNLLSFDFMKSTDLETMWRDRSVAEAIETLRRYFQLERGLDSDESEIRGIVLDFFSFARTRREVASRLNAELRNRNARENHNTAPGLVVVDFFDEKTSNYLFATYMSDQFGYLRAKDAGERCGCSF